MAVTDYQRFGIHVCCQHGMKFGLTAGLQTKVVPLAVADNFLNYGAHLVHLDWENDEMLSLIVVFLASCAETSIGLLDTAVQNIRKAQKHRCCNMLGGKAVNHLLQVYACTVLLGFHIDMSLFVDTKEIYSPSLDVVEFFRIFNSPLFHLYYAKIGWPHDQLLVYVLFFYPDLDLSLWVLVIYMPVASLNSLTLSHTFSRVFRRLTSKTCFAFR